MSTLPLVLDSALSSRPDAALGISAASDAGAGAAPSPFDVVHDRTGTGSLKWDFAAERGRPASALPLWVADMDHIAAPCVTSALLWRVRHGIFGYSEPDDAYNAALIGWFSRRYGWEVEAAWNTVTPGVVPALALAVRALTAPGEAVLIEEPVYYPFRDVVEVNERTVAAVPLVHDANGVYRRDLAALEETIEATGARLLLLCNPHNPVGRVWSREELAALEEVTARHGVVVVADEIHADLALPGFATTPFASLSEAAAAHTITCTSPSKSFNLAGLQVANILISDAHLRRTFRRELATTGYSQPNTLGLTACRAAYESGDAWLDELREHTNWDAWGAITKTTMARPRAQVWCMSNAGDDSSVVLMTLRKKAHLALGDPDGICTDEAVGEADESLGIFEWSASPGRGVWDREGWQEGNPSLGYTMAEDSLASAAATDPEPVYRTECLCQWVTGLVEGPFGEGAWEACEDPNGVIPDDAPVTFAVDVNWDRGSAFIGVCGVREDGRPQVEVAAGRPGGDWIEWVPEWFRGFVDADHPARVVVQAKGCPSASLVQPLSEVEGLEVILWQGSDLAIGCGLFYDRVVAARGDASGLPPLAHRGQEALSLPARTASQRVFGDGWYWDRRNSPHNAAPLVAVTEALWDQLTNAPEAPSIFEEGPIDLF